MNNQEAIKVFNNIGDHVKNDTMEDEVFISDKIYEAAETAITALEAQQADRWVPITERLPVEKTRVLVQDEKGMTAVTYRQYGQFINVFANNGYLENIKAWRPLPKPWKEVQP